MAAGGAMPAVRTWVSLTNGKELVDVAVHPLVVSTSIETAVGPVGGLKARAELFINGQQVDSLVLTDTGTMRTFSTKRPSWPISIQT